VARRRSTLRQEKCLPASMVDRLARAVVARRLTPAVTSCCARLVRLARKGWRMGRLTWLLVGVAALALAGCRCQSCGAPGDPRRPLFSNQLRPALDLTKPG
jgi:hypothetical protein